MDERKPGERADEPEKKPEIRSIGQKKIRRKSGRIREKAGNREHWPTKLMEQKHFFSDAADRKGRFPACAVMKSTHQDT